jgi:putative FmdB family regulatory protein
MPLYDFHCPACNGDVTLLLRLDEAGVCPTCGGTQLERRYAPFAVGGRAAAAKSNAPAAAHASSAHAHAHDHAPSAPCSAAPPSSSCTPEAGGCRSSYVDSVLKKYVP